MLYLNPVIHYWLNDSFNLDDVNEAGQPINYWIMGDQVNLPAKAQNKPAFGFYVISSRKNLSMYDRSSVYNAENDRFDVTLTNSYEANVAIDIYSKNSAVNNTDASYIAALIETNVHSDHIKEYFDLHNVGFLRFTRSENMSYVESTQARKRWRLECAFNIVFTLDKQIDRVDEVDINYNITR
jgi:hypothetical protein